MLKKLSSNQSQVAREEKDKIVALKKQEKEQKKAEQDMLKMKKQLEKEQKQAEKERKQAEKEQKQAEKQAEKAQKQAEKEHRQAEKKEKQAEKEQKQAEKEQKQAEKKEKQAEKEQKQVEKQAEKEQKQVEKQAEKEQKQVEKQAEKEQKQVEKQAEKEQKQAEKEQKQAEKAHREAEKKQKNVRKKKEEGSTSKKASSQTPDQPIELVESACTSVAVASCSMNEAKPQFQTSSNPVTEATTEKALAPEDLPADDLLAAEAIHTNCDAANTNNDIQPRSEHKMAADTNQDETSKPLGEHEEEEPSKVTSTSAENDRSTSLSRDENKENLFTDESSQQQCKKERKNKFFKPPLQVKAGTKRSSLLEELPAKKKVRKTQQSKKLKGKSQHSRKSVEGVAPANTVGPVWVQCDNPDCLKWRVMKGVTDPALVPDKWYCSMNTGELVLHTNAGLLCPLVIRSGVQQLHCPRAGMV